MKKYAEIIICLALVGSSAFAQTSGGAGGDTPGSGTSGSSTSGGAAGGTGSSTQGGTSSGPSVNDPSGAQSDSSQPQSGGATSGGAAGTSGAEVGTSGTSGAQSSGVINDPSGASPQRPGTITIQGTVSSEQERQEIEEQLKLVQGVNSVVNMLRVSPQGGTSGAGGTGTQGAGEPSRGTSDQP